MKKTSLIYIPLQRSQATYRLLCFPYAGGSAATYMQWAEQLDADIELAVIQLPGRGIRLVEAAYSTMEEIVDAITNAMNLLRDKPFVFFGHSMGARVAYEVCLALEQKNKPLPVHFFASACAAPNIERELPPTYHLPNKVFLDKIAALNGSPQAVLEDEELMELILPALRADFKIIETYCNKNKHTLPLGVSVLVGSSEKFKPAALENWFDLFESNTGIHTVKGDHFFVDKNKQPVIDFINTTVTCQLATAESA
ncbi:thioesterase II family protein [Saccharophagus degradans]|uniref:Oleoyl-(Acyl-carrier protein) hydrolase n=1 Tax=Saccharophagus degradans (strain 2-40 / ATCC 43961 / DSM 17024) TaxID=203122 RepID=Q21E96_SACD2|nr:alpha/beta fold hydrolase [Saccharophagus degradans]ABD82983.1 Oleoyl-(acyl-carrier protein) hydrolase [Saccharophagus degradans 2-40]